MSRRRSIRLIRVGRSALRPAANFEQLEPKRLDPGQHPIERGLIWQRSAEHGLTSLRLGTQVREGGEQRLAQVSTDADLVAR